ncbi:MAG: hypothetical protein EBZ48_12895, partial [Proteobacteria bacterium]|nr:hypothetical protein [Pseudomonadota bacterium]
GIISTSPGTRPYSRLGRAPFTPLPDTIQHGDYQFFAPGPERAATVQFLTGLCGHDHILLPSVILNGQTVKPTSNVSISPVWHLAVLGEETRAELSKRDPLIRFYNLIFEWGAFLSFMRFDIPQTLTELANSLGLNICQQPQRFPGGPTPFVVSGGEPGSELIVHQGAPDSSGRQEVSIGWAKHWGMPAAG